MTVPAKMVVTDTEALEMDMGKPKTEDDLAAEALADILTSVMLRAYEEPMGPRTFLYVWERAGLRWLIRYCDDRWHAGSLNDWLVTFITLNRDPILAEDGRMDFNLRSFSERESA
jgi:hypothetical protein